MLVDRIAEMIAKERGHRRDLCNDKCHCYRLAGEIVTLTETTYAAEHNRLAEKLDDTTTELQQMRRFIGE